MHLPSIARLTEAAWTTARRFPLTLAAAGLGTIASLLIVQYDVDPGEPLWWFSSVALACSLGIPLFIALELFQEIRALRGALSLILPGAAVIALALYGWALPADVFAPPHAAGVRHLFLLAGAHALAAFLPLSRASEGRAFWYFNHTLLLRLLTSALFGLILYAGLALALLAVEHLFGATVEGKRYFQLFLFIGGVCTTWFFLGGIPRDLPSLGAGEKPARGITLFVQYVLVPLVAVYLLILYAYLAKILILWDWPKGWVGYLVLGVSVAGFLALVLVRPIGQETLTAWVRRLSSVFLIAEIPLSAVLLLAAWRRVSEYGLTENRYILIVLGCWACIVAALMLVRREWTVRMMPASLCLLALATSVGPWGAFGMSERQQIGRLSGILTELNILRDGRIVPPGRVAAQDTVREVSAIVRYLYEVHGLGGMQSWFTEKLDTLGLVAGTNNRWGDGPPRAFVTRLGLPYLQTWESVSDRRRHRTARAPAAIDVRGGETLIRGVTMHQWRAGSVDSLVGRTELDPRTLRVTVLLRGSVVDEDTLWFDLSALAHRAMGMEGEQPELDGGAMQVEGGGNRRAGRFLLSSLTVRQQGDSLSIEDFAGDVLILEAKGTPVPLRRQGK